MRLTDRDRRLLRDLALSHLLSRDQLLALGYFGSVTRANTRLRALAVAGLVRRLSTPFYSQSLFAVARPAMPLLGERIAALVESRAPSPRFVQHALMVTNVRIALFSAGATGWRFEPQLHTNVRWGGCVHRIRPDGLAVAADAVTAVEVDLGHVAPSKVRAKIQSYQAFAASGEAARQWRATPLSLLIVTTGPRRAAHLSRLLPASPRLSLRVTTFAALGVPLVEGWS